MKKDGHRGLEPRPFRVNPRRARVARELAALSPESLCPSNMDD